MSDSHRLIGLLVFLPFHDVWGVIVRLGECPGSGVSRKGDAHVSNRLKWKASVETSGPSHARQGKVHRPVV